MKLLFALCDVRIYVLSRTRRCDNVGQISHRVKIVFRWERDDGGALMMMMMITDEEKKKKKDILGDASTR